MWAAQYYKCRNPRSFVSSGGLGTMGFGLGAAIGAKTGNPDKTVVNMAGDGSFAMNLNELITASAHGINIVEIVINNSVLGMVRQWQRLFYSKHFSETTLDARHIDYVKLGEAFGIRTFVIEKTEDIAPVLREALEISKSAPVMIEVRIDRDINVLPMIPAGKTLFEAFEMLDHFEAFEYMMQNTQHPLDENLLKEINRRVTSHTLSYRSPEAIPGEYTTTDMAAGDTVFGDHEELIARIPKLLESTEKAIVSAAVHPMILAARFHGFYEYLHPFRDGNGRTGRLISNYILLRLNHPLLIIPSEARQEYISVLRMIRTEATDEHLIRFFFKMAIQRMEEELKQKEANTKRFMTFLF